MHYQDWWERVRASVAPRLGLITQLIEDVTGSKFYVESETHNNQFVGRVPMNKEKFEKKLNEMGFVRNPLSSWKHRTTNEKSEESSFRKVDFDEDDFQLHVILYDGNMINNAETDVIYVYAHWELRWDVHPWAYYRGIDANGPEGVRRMKNLLDERGIVYEPIRP